MSCAGQLRLIVGDVLCINVANQASFYTPQDTLASGKQPTLDGPYGWLDAAHAAITLLPDTSGTPGTHGFPPTPIPGSPETYATLAILNITTNQISVIARVQKGGSVVSRRLDTGGSYRIAGQ